jgi:hypothetical protein
LIDALFNLGGLIAGALTASPGGFASLAAMGFGAFVHRAANRYLPIKVEKSDHHLSEATKDFIPDFVDSIVATQTENWNKDEHPLVAAIEAREGEALTMRAEANLRRIGRLATLVSGAIDHLREERKATKQGFREMMRPEGAIVIEPVRENRFRGWPELTKEEAAGYTRALTSFRGAIDMSDRHIREVYNILGVRRETSAWDAIEKDGLPGYLRWLNEHIEKYPKNLGDTMERMGAKAVLMALKVVKEAGTEGLTKKQVAEAHAKIKPQMKIDAAERWWRSLPPLEIDALKVVESARRKPSILPKKRGRH